MGAVDVVPFIPIRGATPRATASRSRGDVGAEIAERFGVPVYLYEDAASSRAPPQPRGDPQGAVRRLRRQDEGAATGGRTSGPAAPHPTAGAVAVGARPFLIAYNINLGTRDLVRSRTGSRSRSATIGRVPLRQGDGRGARRPRDRPGLDQHDELPRRRRSTASSSASARRPSATASRSSARRSWGSRPPKRSSWRPSTTSGSKTSPSTRSWKTS